MLLVFAYHLHNLLRQVFPNSFSDFACLIGPLGTDAFFAISGCFIYRSLLRRPRSYGSFVARRIQRIYPVFATALAVHIGLCLLVPSRTDLPAAVPAAVISIASNTLLLPGLLQHEPLLAVSWALSYIFAFYLFCPALVRVLKGLNRRVRILSITGMWVIAIALSYRTHLFPLRTTLLLIGPLIFELSHLPRVMRLAALTAAVGALLRFGLAGVPALTGSALLITGFFLASFGAIRPLQRFLETAPMQWLGFRSYSFYLCHGFPLMAMSAWLRPGLTAPQFWLIQPCAFAAALLCTQIMFVAVERRWSIIPRQMAQSSRTQND
jgi:peptidoglycan/LPS O-acetylase OafA/YrhL